MGFHRIILKLTKQFCNFFAFYSTCLEKCIKGFLPSAISQTGQSNKLYHTSEVPPMVLGSLLWNLSCVCSSLVFLQRWGGSSTLDGMVQKWWILWVLFTCSIRKKKVFMQRSNTSQDLDWPGLLKTMKKIVKRNCKKVTFLVHEKMIEWRWMSSMCDNYDVQ